MHTCSVEDDAGNICNQPVNKKQWRQDGMCERCAEALWVTFYSPLLMNKETTSFLFKDFPQRIASAEKR